MLNGRSVNMIRVFWHDQGFLRIAYMKNYHRIGHRIIGFHGKKILDLFRMVPLVVNFKKKLEKNIFLFKTSKIAHQSIFLIKLLRKILFLK
jgi:hypothetical protein